MIRPKIAVVCRTIGLEYDDRIRKECISLSKNADVKIFVTFESNEEKEGITSYGVPYKSFKLVSREKIKSGRLLLVKALEFYFKVKPHLKEFDLLWAHEEYTFLFSLLSAKNKFIWDLHEIPQLFDKPILRHVFQYIEKRSKYIIHANSFRIKYLMSRGLIKHFEKHKYIRNFPDSAFVESNLIPGFYREFNEWLNGKQYVYLQGISSPNRYPYNSLASILQTTDLKIIVVGSFKDKDIKERLSKELGAAFNERVFFTGMINQLASPILVKNALFSMVFYRTTTPNQQFCEANRFYQSLVFGVPVITGNNEPLNEIISKNHCGIALNTDGRIMKDINYAINQMINNYHYYKKNAVSTKNKFIWNDDFANHLISDNLLKQPNGNSKKIAR
jgi:hypothetical protein